MPQTLESYTTLVQAEVDDTSTSSRPIIQQSIKEVYQDFLREAYRYLVGTTDENETAIVGQRNYTTDNGFTDLIAVLWKPVSGTTFNQLIPVSEEHYIQSHLNDSNGTPSKYYVKGQTIYSCTPPSEAGTFKFIYYPVVTELAGTASSLVPDRYTEVIKLGGSYKYKAYDGDPATLEYKAFYEEAKRKAILELATAYLTPKPSLY